MLYLWKIEREYVTRIEAIVNLLAEIWFKYGDQ